MIRPARLALVALGLLAAQGAFAQWREEPMELWLGRSGETVLAGNFSPATTGDDLLELYGTSSAAVRPWHRLLSQDAPYAFPVPRAARAFRAAYGTDFAPAVVSQADTGLEIVYATDPLVVHTCVLNPSMLSSPEALNPFVPSPVKLLDRAPGPAGRPDTIVLPYWLHDTPRAVYVVEIGTGAAPACTQRVLAVPPLNAPPEEPAAWGIQVSPTAIASGPGGVQDVAVGIFGGVILYAQRSLQADLATADLSDPIFVGTLWQLPPFHPPWLPDTVPGLASSFGVAALDVDGDGIPDLVFPQTSAAVASFQGELVWVHGTGNPADFADPALAPWHDLAVHPDLLLVDPFLVRPLVVEGEAAAAIWDRDAKELVVVRAGAAPGALRVWRAPAPGGRAKDIRLVDLVGSDAHDLVVTMDNAPLPDSVLVYPDLGLPSPRLSWAPGSPGTPARGVPHPLEVVPDPSGPASVTVEWIEGAPTTAPVAEGNLLFQHVFPPVCTVPAPDLVVLVRAIDDTGVFSDLRATLPLASLQPAISLAGATPPGRLALPPGGTTAVLDGVAATGCGAAAWDTSALPTAATVLDDPPGPTSLRRTILLPEAAYPALLADPSLAVSLATTDPGAVQPVVTLRLELDASGLVEVIHDTDRTALAGGEVAVLRTRLRSRLAVPLPGVRIVDALAGLAPAGAPTVSGAALVALAADGADLVVDVLPAAPGEVTIELPVRSASGRGASAVEVRASGGWLLTAPARAEAGAEALPGCGCGTDTGPGGLALLALAFAGRRRRRLT